MIFGVTMKLIYLLINLLIYDIMLQNKRDRRRFCMASVVSAITNTIPITQFNRGLAGKIFEEVKKNGTKAVMKNNAVECVLMSPQEYVALMDEVNDARLLTIAAERVAAIKPDELIPEEEVNRRLGIAEDELEGFEETEIE